MMVDYDIKGIAYNPKNIRVIFMGSELVDYKPSDRFPDGCFVLTCNRCNVKYFFSRVGRYWFCPSCGMKNRTKLVGFDDKNTRLDEWF